MRPPRQHRRQLLVDPAAVQRRRGAGRDGEGAVPPGASKGGAAREEALSIVACCIRMDSQMLMVSADVQHFPLLIFESRDVTRVVDTIT